MKKFLRYQLELVGTHENDLTDKLVSRLNDDHKNKKGIYSSIFGETCQIAAHRGSDAIVLCGCIFADTQKECKKIYSTLKLVAKSTFGNCKKTSDLFLVTGDRLF